MIKFVTFITVLIQLAFASGGNEVGNGGNVLYSSKSQRAVMFYDHYECINKYELKPHWPNLANRTEESIALSFLKRLAPLDPDLYLQLRDWTMSFKDDSIFVDHRLPLINDTGMIFIPYGFEFLQLIIQNKGIYKIDYELWQQLPNYEKAIAILHETIYRRHVKLNPKVFSSRDSRYLVALIISNEISRFSKKEFESLLRQLKF